MSPSQTPSQVPSQVPSGETPSEALSSVPSQPAGQLRQPMPTEFDPERRGQDAPRPAGGRDPDPDLTARTERRYLWLLVLMIALIVGITTLVGIFGLIVVALGGTT